MFKRCNPYLSYIIKQVYVGIGVFTLYARKCNVLTTVHSTVYSDTYLFNFICLSLPFYNKTNKTRTQTHTNLYLYAFVGNKILKSLILHVW